jgi:hypothetical protein
VPENRLERLIHVGGVPGNKNNPDIAEAGRATRSKPGQSGNLGGRPKRTPYADACRAVLGCLCPRRAAADRDGDLRVAARVGRRCAAEWSSGRKTWALPVSASACPARR